MDILLKKKKRESRRDATARIEVRLQKPTRENYTEVDFEDICNELNVVDKFLVDETNSDIDFESDENVEVCSNGSEVQRGPVNRNSGEIVPEDLLRKGAGYDLEDPFVDDSDVIGFLPQTSNGTRRTNYRTTIYGGYFVHCGDGNEFVSTELEELQLENEEVAQAEESKKQKRRKKEAETTEKLSDNNTDNITTVTQNANALTFPAPYKRKCARALQPEPKRMVGRAPTSKLVRPGILMAPGSPVKVLGSPVNAYVYAPNRVLQIPPPKPRSQFALKQVSYPGKPRPPKVSALGPRPMRYASQFVQKKLRYGRPIVSTPIVMAVGPKSNALSTPVQSPQKLNPKPTTKKFATSIVNSSSGVSAATASPNSKQNPTASVPQFAQPQQSTIRNPTNSPQQPTAPVNLPQQPTAPSNLPQQPTAPANSPQQPTAPANSPRKRKKPTPKKFAASIVNSSPGVSAATFSQQLQAPVWYPPHLPEQPTAPANSPQKPKAPANTVISSGSSVLKTSSDSSNTSSIPKQTSQPTVANIKLTPATPHPLMSLTTQQQAQLAASIASLSPADAQRVCATLTQLNAVNQLPLQAQYQQTSLQNQQLKPQVQTANIRKSIPSVKSNQKVPKPVVKSNLPSEPPVDPSVFISAGGFISSLIQPNLMMTGTSKLGVRPGTPISGSIVRTISNRGIVKPVSLVSTSTVPIINRPQLSAAPIGMTMPPYPPSLKVRPSVSSAVKSTPTSTPTSTSTSALTSAASTSLQQSALGVGMQSYEQLCAYLIAAQQQLSTPSINQLTPQQQSALRLTMPQLEAFQQLLHQQLLHQQHTATPAQTTNQKSNPTKPNEK
ncbi:Yemanuclein-alpha [Aphelenchoides besseyi]|nr:Yemanuclein-alpha [Aphelenchoides besseyi]